MPKTHILKCIDLFYDRMIAGQKNFDLRFNDRDFQVGDHLQLQRYNDREERLTGEQGIWRVNYILSDPEFGLRTDHVILDVTLQEILRTEDLASELNTVGTRANNAFKRLHEEAPEIIGTIGLLSTFANPDTESPAFGDAMATLILQIVDLCDLRRSNTSRLSGIGTEKTPP